jgi:deoxycytidine triphosphate deaminase
MALSDLDFQEHRNRRFVIEPFKESSLTPTGYDLRFGFGIILPQKIGDSVGVPGAIGMQSKTLLIPEHHGALFVTVERMRLSGKVLGTIHGKSRFSAKGLITQSVTVDPNFGAAQYSGRLFLYFYNTSPFGIHINEKDPIATLVLSSLDTETHAEPASKTYEDILSHYDTAYQSFMQREQRVCDPIRGYLEQFRHSPGEKEFEQAVNGMTSFREARSSEWSPLHGGDD